MKCKIAIMDRKTFGVTLNLSLHGTSKLTNDTKNNEIKQI
jgi:hypothetical protein